jgi:hypothetical protein
MSARQLTDDQNEDCRQREGNRDDDVCINPVNDISIEKLEETHREAAG